MSFWLIGWKWIRIFLKKNRRICQLGLYHAGAREYDSREGRFLTRDAFRYLDYRDPAGWNLFLYGKGNPLRYRDPSGHECVEERGYWERTANHALKGDFTEDVTLAGIGINMVLGFFNADLPMDVRDIAATFTVNFAPGEFSWWVTAFTNIVALVPAIGVAKYLDDIAAWAKNMWKGFTKNLDTFVDVYKHSDGFLDGIGAGLKAVWRNQDEVTKLLEETLEAGQKRLDDLKELEKLADSGEDLLGDLGKSGKYWDDVVESGTYSGDLMSAEEAARYSEHWRELGIGSDNTWKVFKDINPNGTVDDYFEIVQKQSPWPLGETGSPTTLKAGDRFFFGSRK